MIKSFLILSIICDLVGLGGLSSKFDTAIIRENAGIKKVAVASTIDIKLPDIMPRPVAKPNAPKPVANARHYLLADLDSGSVLAKQSHKTRVPIASTTKIMTAVVALENYNLDEPVTITQRAATQVGADTYLLPNEKISVESLLNCLLIKSGNDSAYALAQHMDKTGEGSVQDFVDKMNAKAKELGMEDTHYNDPAGLDVTGYSSAYDLFLVTKKALTFPEFKKIVAKDSEAVKSIDGSTWHELKNSNRLVAEYKYPGAIGVKTGYMPEAGHCLVGAAKRNGHTLISIVLNTYADTASASADEARRLLDWGFENITWQ